MVRRRASRGFGATELRVLVLGVVAFMTACGAGTARPNASGSRTVAEPPTTARAARPGAEPEPAPLAATPSAATTSTAARPPAEPTLPVELARLPAVSADGSRIAVLASYADGARAHPKVDLLVLDTRGDRTLSRVVVDDPSAFDEVYAAARPERLRVAADSLQGETWTPLVKLATAPDPSAPPSATLVVAPLLATNARTVVQYVEPILTITFDAKTALRREQRAWSDVPHKGCSACDTCPPAQASLESVAIDEAKRVALVVVQYRSGSDSCWERDQSYRAVSF